MIPRISSLFFAALVSIASPQSFSATEVTITPPEDQTQSLYFRNYSYNFGSVPVGYMAYHDFYLVNRGGNTFINNIYTFGTSFNSYNTCPRRLYRGSHCIVRVYFRPWNVGFHTGQTYISTSEGTTYIRLSGYAR